MSIGKPNIVRRLLPRWRTVADAITFDELGNRNTTERVFPKYAKIQIEHLEQLWHFEKSFENAAELVTCAVVLDARSTVVKDAASFIANAGSESRSALRELAERILGDHTPPSRHEWKKKSEIDCYYQIAQLKYRVRITPRDAISWIEMARIYTILGQLKSARKCIETAVILAPNNRFTLRAAARFYVHLKQTERGLFLLRHAKATPYDPWLLATETSLSTLLEKHSKFRKHSLDILKRNQWTPWDTSELYGAIATFLAHDGNLKKARKLFRLSIRDPNENTLAQAQWAAIRNFGSPVASNIFDRCSKAHEASALCFQEQQKWNKALTSCWKWNEMEPTSSVPLLTGGFINLVALEDGKEAIKFLDAAENLKLNDFSVFNNLAVAHAYCGNLDDAQKNLSYAEDVYKYTSDSSKLYLSALTATKGLLAYRDGRIEEARNLYLRAVNIAEKNNTHQTAIIFWHLLREEAKINPSEVEDALQILYKKTKPARTEIKELESLHNLIQANINKKKPSQSLGARFSITPIYKALTNY